VQKNLLKNPEKGGRGDGPFSNRRRFQASETQKDQGGKKKKFQRPLQNEKRGELRSGFGNIRDDKKTTEGFCNNRIRGKYRAPHKSKIEAANSRARRKERCGRVKKQTK